MDRFNVLDDAVVDMLICCREHRTMVRLFRIALEGYPEEREHLLEVLDMIEDGSGRIGDGPAFLHLISIGIIRNHLPVIVGILYASVTCVLP